MTDDLFGAKPRRARRQLMHVSDAGDSCSGDDGEGVVIAQFACKRCGHETDWIQVDTVTEARRGIPCPFCNNAREEVRDEQTRKTTG